MERRYHFCCAVHYIRSEQAFAPPSAVLIGSPELVATWSESDFDAEPVPVLPARDRDLGNRMSSIRKRTELSPRRSEGKASNRKLEHDNRFSNLSWIPGIV